MKKLILLPFALILFGAPMADDLLVEGFEGGSIPGNWQVWEERGAYFKQHPVQFLGLSDLLTNTSGEGELLGEGLWGMKVEKDYVTTLRINVPMKDFARRYPDHPYLARFRELSPACRDWPRRFQDPVITPWAMSYKQIKSTQAHYIGSAGNIEAVDRWLKHFGRRIKVAVVMAIQNDSKICKIIF